MKRLIIILSILVMSQSILCQSKMGIKDFIKNSQYVFLIEVSSIDTLEPEKFFSSLIYKNKLTYKIHDDFSDKPVDENIPILCQVSEHSHMRKAEPEIGKQYIAFTNYDQEQKSYVLPEHKWSLMEVSQSNLELVKNIIKTITKHPALSQCEYFKLISTNFEEPISAINNELISIGYQNDIDSIYCIDVEKKEVILNSFIKNGNSRLLPFISDYKQNKLDEYIIQQIEINTNNIKQSNTGEWSWMEEASNILGCLSELSFIKENKTAQDELNELFDIILYSTRTEYISHVKSLLEKYGS